jgi:alpha-mannosidase
MQRVPQPAGGTVKYLVDPGTIPAIGYSTLAVHFGPREAKTLVPEEFKAKVYENQFYRLEFAPGGLRSIYDKELRRELFNPEGFLGGEIFMLDSVGNGAGEFGETQQPSWKNLERLSQYAPSWRLIESGPIRLGWRMEQPMRQVTVRVDVFLYAGVKRLDFDVELLNWSGEKYKEFRMAVPVNIPDGQVAYEVPYGVLEVGKDEIDAIPFEGWYGRHARKIHPREVLDWISVSGGGHTVMLSSSVAVWDYLDAQEKKDRLTLLQPILLASRKSCHGLGNWYLQKGDHRYHFALTSFAGDWRSNFRFGNEINCPLASIVGAPEAAKPTLPSSLSLCRVSAPAYVVSTIKAADDGNGIILRGYEVSGGEAEVTLKVPLELGPAQATSLIEENLPEKIEVGETELRFRAGSRAVNALRVVGKWKP